MFLFLQLAAWLNIAALVGVCVFLLWNGLPVLSWEFLTTNPTQGMTAGGIWPCIMGTLLLSLGALAVAFPVGVASEIGRAHV